MKSVAGRLRMDLAQYREVQAFSQFASDLDKATQAQLQRGARMTALLVQPQYAPMTAAEQVISIFAGFNGYLDEVPVPDISRYESEMQAFVAEKYPEIPETVQRTGLMSDDTQATLRKALDAFNKQFKD
ncbi:MAG: hypothetical protein NT029_14815 [Armatimonadetes bacterium]|nr:hypothetical protein [Armatimonadota bacterium]